MRIKHSKYKNTGLLYELLARQITSDLVERKNPPAVTIFKKYFSGETALVQEYRIYKTIMECSKVSTNRAEQIISASLKAAKNLNLQELRQMKYNLIAEIEKNYNLEEFFSAQVPNYRPLAALYCLLEADRSREFVEPLSIVHNRQTLLEHMTSGSTSEKNTLLEEFSTYDKDLRLLTFKVLLEKFNKKYVGLLPEQKEILKQVIQSDSPKKLRSLVNEQFERLYTEISGILPKVPRGIEKIKLSEALKMIKNPVENTEKNLDKYIVRVLQFQGLLNEIKTIL